MERKAVYTSEDGNQMDILIKDNTVFISQEQVSKLFSISPPLEVYNLKEFIDLCSSIDRIKTLHFKIWANTQLSNKIEFGDALTKITNTKNK